LEEWEVGPNHTRHRVKNTALDALFSAI
jgi:hypothetical protein